MSRRGAGFAVLLTQKQHEVFKRVARKYRISMSCMARLALRQYIGKLEGCDKEAATFAEEEARLERNG